MLNHPFRCILIGVGSLPIQCAQILKSRGHQILGVVSDDAVLAEWAAQENLSVCSPTGDLLAFLNQQPFDYLFSIVNPLVLSEEILRLPKKGAINYHDSPLPKYAGLYASSWALLHGETQHAVTWHEIKPGIDVGDILQQSQVEIAPQDTALTLNARCYEAAIASFATLVDELAEDATISVPQDLSQRSYFSRVKKPAIGLQFHWGRTAEELETLVRALDFGPFPNPLRLPKLLVGNDGMQELVIVSQLKVLKTSSQALPGTVLAIAPSGLQVATTTCDVVLQRLSNLQGRAIAIPELMSQVGLEVGDRLPDIDPLLAQQIDQLDSQIAKHEAYWVAHMSQLQPLSLPESLRAEADSAPTDATFQAYYLPLPTTVQQAICDYADFTSGEVLTAALAVYLTKMQQDSSFDVGFHYPALRADLEGLELFFSNQVPWRIQFDRQQSFRVALKDLTQQTQQLQPHKTYSCGLIARYPALVARKELQAESPFPISIHQVDSFSVAGYPTDHSQLSQSPNWRQRNLAQHLTLLVPQDGATCGWVYHTSVLTQPRVAAMATQFLAFLEDLLAHPDQDLASISLSTLQTQRLTEVEWQQIVGQWNATEVEYPHHLRLHDLFETQVSQSPDSIAVVFGEQSLTYGELNCRANQLAHHLQALGVAPEVCVGVCLERSLEMVVALMAILKAGGAYVPLDPTYPIDRLSHILTDARLAAVLTQQKLRSVLPTEAVPTLCLDQDWETIATSPATNPASSATATTLAYIIYTSGSTGKPKGVLIEHRGAVNTILDINRRFGVNPKDRVLAVCSLNFDLSVYDIFGLLAAGGTIVLPPPAIAPDLDAWYTLMHQEQITVWNSAPPVMQMVASHLADYRRTLPASLRLVMLSGDWIPVTLPGQIHQLKARQPPIQVVSLGGATEASIWSILYPIETIAPDWKSIPYGRPMANQQFYILDEQQNPIPAGEIGELYIGGDGVARGYHNRPDLNASKFIPDPFHPQPGYRLYRTGDLGRYTPDGTIEFLGRIDHQVKIRGFRVELGEIETVLSQHESIRETAVLPREDATGTKQLVAYLVLDREQVDVSSDATTTQLVSQVRHFLKTKLPDYMVPAAFVVVASLPLTPNGKLDRKALPEPEFNLGLEDSTHVAPTDDYERQLVEIWEEFLRVAPIGVQDNFFELGGHSLLATRLWAQVEKTFNITLPLATLFQAPTIAELASRLRQPGAVPLCPSLVVVQRGETSSSKPPLFFIHTLGRGLKFCRPLVRHLDPKQTVYGLSTQIAGEPFGSNQAEDLASHYIQQIQTLQPTGPYLLAGISYGGLIAYEMARQLSHQGQQVALLAPLDSHMPEAAHTVSVAQQFVRHHRQLLQSGPRYLLKTMKAVLIGRLYQLQEWSRCTYLDLGSALLNRLNCPLTDDMQDYWFERENEQAQTLYRPKPYQGVVTLFKATEDEDSARVQTDPALGWREYVEQLIIHQIPGTHLGMLTEPKVKILATRLQQCITEQLTAEGRQAPETTPIVSGQIPSAKERLANPRSLVR